MPPLVARMSFVTSKQRDLVAAAAAATTCAAAVDLPVPTAETGEGTLLSKAIAVLQHEHAGMLAGLQGEILRLQQLCAGRGGGMTRWLVVGM
jgi:hypothetical protein